MSECVILSRIGNYWIDPNEGSSKDAIEVFCKGPETCITPTKEVHMDIAMHTITQFNPSWVARTGESLPGTWG